MIAVALVPISIAVGAVLSYQYDSLVPGALCLMVAVCAYLWRLITKERK
jgi:uncharacterized membrane protein